MPAGHTVLRSHTVVSGFPLRFSAADAWGDALVAGTPDGALLVLAEAPHRPGVTVDQELRFEARCLAQRPAAGGSPRRLRR